MNTGAGVHLVCCLCFSITFCLHRSRNLSLIRRVLFGVHSRGQMRVSWLFSCPSLFLHQQSTLISPHLKPRVRSKPYITVLKERIHVSYLKTQELFHLSMSLSPKVEPSHPRQFPISRAHSLKWQVKLGQKFTGECSTGFAW